MAGVRERAGRLLAVVWLAMFGCVAPAVAQDLSGLARLDPAASSVTEDDGGVSVRLGLSQPVPWRVRILDQPPRVLLDFREVDWTGLDQLVFPKGAIVDHRAGRFRPGWSRLVIELAGPMEVAQAAMVTDGPVTVDLRLVPTDAATFERRAALPEPPEWDLPDAVPLAAPTASAPGDAVIVVLDPGHGGLDPGAEREGTSEADLMLTFARELKDVLVRDGTFQVVMTREEDVFVPLEARISAAREARASVFLSLHADALAEGEAVGATIYTLSDEASDAASVALAERHDRDDLLAGIDLSAQDDVVAGVLMDMARTETSPRVARLSQAFEAAFRAASVTMHREPQQRAGFSVLKSPDIPSALIELGFLSSAADFKRLTDPNWRAGMAGAIVAGLKAWHAEDAALRAARDP